MSLLSTLFGTKGQNSSNINVLSPQEYKNAILNKNLQLIDVRTPNEYRSGHIDKAINIDLYSIQFETKFNKLQKDRPVYIYCRSGARSRNASKRLAEMGFTEVYDLRGGITNY